MKRDMDLLRELLLRLESLPLPWGTEKAIEPGEADTAIKGYSHDQVSYHLALLREVGFINCPGSQPMAGITFSGLSWEGHDFLDAIRDSEIWRKTKNGAEATGSFTFDLLKELAKGLIKTKIEEHTGIKL